MPYRILCKDTFWERREARPGLALVPSHLTALHKFRVLPHFACYEHYRAKLLCGALAFKVGEEKVAPTVAQFSTESAEEPNFGMASNSSIIED